MSLVPVTFVRALHSRNNASSVGNGIYVQRTKPAALRMRERWADRR